MSWSRIQCRICGKTGIFRFGWSCSICGIVCEGPGYEDPCVSCFGPKPLYALTCDDARCVHRADSALGEGIAEKTLLAAASRKFDISSLKETCLRYALGINWGVSHTKLTGADEIAWVILHSAFARERTTKSKNRLAVYGYHEHRLRTTELGRTMHLPRKGQPFSALCKAFDNVYNTFTGYRATAMQSLRASISVSSLGQRETAENQRPGVFDQAAGERVRALVVAEPIGSGPRDLQLVGAASEEPVMSVSRDRPCDPELVATEPESPAEPTNEESNQAFIEKIDLLQGVPLFAATGASPSARKPKRIREPEGEANNEEPTTAASEPQTVAGSTGRSARYVTAEQLRGDRGTYTPADKPWGAPTRKSIEHFFGTFERSKKQ